MSLIIPGEVMDNTTKPIPSFRSSPTDHPLIRDLKEFDKPKEEPPEEEEGILIKEAILYCFREAEKAKAPYLKSIDRLQQRYNNQYDHGGKEDWQSKKNFPKLMVIVERISAYLTRQLTLAREWFQVFTYHAGLTPFASLFEEMLRESFEDHRVKFLKVFQQVVKSGLMAQMLVLMPTWTEDGIQVINVSSPSQGNDDNDLSILPTESTVTSEDDYVFPNSHLQILVQNPRHIFLDPTGRDRFKMRTYSYTIGEFRAEGEKREFEFIEEVVASAGTYDKDTQMKVTTNKGVAQSRLTDLDKIFNIEFWGDLYDEDGFLLAENIYAVVSNKEYLVFYDDTPFAHKEVPIITCSLIDNPFAIYNESPVSIALDAIEAWVEFMNMLIDFFQTRILPQYEINESVMSYDENPEEGGYPGKYWYKNGPEKLITSVELADIAPQFWGFLETLQHELQEETGLLDAGGSKMPRRKMGSDERRSRQADSGMMFDFAFKNIETDLLEPMLKQSFINMLQFTPDKQWRGWINNKIAKLIEGEQDSANAVQQQAPQAQREQKKFELSPGAAKLRDMYENLAEMTADARVAKFGKSIYFKTEVFSAMADRQSELEHITFFLGTVGKIPAAAAAVKWIGILKRAVTAFQWPVEEVLRTEAEYSRILQYMSKEGLMSGYLGDADEEQGQAPSTNPQEGMARSSVGAAGIGGPPMGGNTPTMG